MSPHTRFGHLSLRYNNHRFNEILECRAVIQDFAIDA